MDFEQRPVSSTPKRIYRTAASLFEYRETVMQPGRAAALEIRSGLYIDEILRPVLERAQRERDRSRDRGGPRR